eukprot:gnl/MRDRNA2_/MRDRNA2_82699_c0_seq1.p1 gnl/MRDRNA2_/MRDRNA2_82699_c0~~gnl/MRDRNA2_/MRDRNA2_82699_c0_seq1.p1  ORF type:complete len:478 (+),score=62.89 gnl/MRDRNA2_/MRDRNA2_82699_c0_seq1:54-1487(+)
MPGFSMLHKIWRRFPNVVERMWWSTNMTGGDLAPTQVLGGKRPRNDSHYSSFLIQDSKRTLNRLLKQLPFAEPDFLQPASDGVTHHDKAWVFFGRNNDWNTTLLAVSEHTDQITFNTWHIQCSGTKTWLVRPASELQLWSAAGYLRPQLGTPADAQGHRRLKVLCEEGDMLIINTQLWWHQTQLVFGSPSFSIAREFAWTNKTKCAEPGCENLQKILATKPWDVGQLIFREKPLLAVQSNKSKREYICCERCALPIGTPALHLALLRKEVSRKDIEQGRIAKYKDWVPRKVRMQGKAGPRVRRIVHGAGGGLFCSSACARRGRAKASEVPDFAYRSADFTSEETESCDTFLSKYVEHIARSLRYCNAYQSAANLVCTILGGTAIEKKSKLCKRLMQIASALKKLAPIWRGRVLYEKASSIEVGLKRPKPNVEVVFSYNMRASVIATRPIRVGEHFNVPAWSKWENDSGSSSSHDEET